MSEDTEPVTKSRQLPEGEAIFLDHVAHFVPDMAAAHQDLNRLGFVQTPYTLHTNMVGEPPQSVPSGTANRCVMLNEGYLEFISVSDPSTPLGERTARQMARYVGLHLIAFSTAEPEAAQGRLTLTGFHPDPLVHLRRPVTLPDGGEGEAAFTCVRVRAQDMPEGRVQFVTHHTEAEVWQQRWMNHGNGIVALRDVVVVGERLDKTAARYCWFLDRGSAKPVTNHLWRVALDRGGVVLADPDGLEAVMPGIELPDVPFIAGYGLLSGDLAATRAFLAERGFAPVEHGASLILHLPDSLGGTLVIAERETDFPWAG